MPDYQRLSDPDLIAAYRMGDGDAFAELYDRYAGALFSAFLASGLSREIAADHVNDRFIEAADRLEREDPDPDLETWLFGSAVGLDGVDIEPPDPEEVVPAPPALRPRVLDQVDRRLTTPVAAEVSTPRIDPDWMKVGAFVLVTLVVGLIGLAVSAQFEPINPPPTTPPLASPPEEEALVPTTSTTTVGSVSPTTSPPDEPSTTTTPPPPGEIEASTDSVDFGSDATSGEIQLSNSGGQATQWAIAPSSGAIAVSAGEGELAPGESVTIEVRIDRETVAEGELAESITISWSGGDIPIALVGTNEANPIVHNPQAAPSSVQVSGGDGCTTTQTRVSARIRDTSPLERVVVRWSPDGNGEQETEMAAVGNDMFEATIGPFLAAQTATARVVAFDERGNAGGATTSISVAACP